ncbi:MAG: TIGR01212 family radical SAM protein [Oscillospiraceae bacterium]|nr:TIGR01212 family radical SAM protein [Oscillospiraceae bacterium]
MTYRTLNQHYQEKFGCKVYKLALDGGFTCPNRDGTLGTGGCVFCSARGGGEFAEGGESLRDQLARARDRVRSKNRNGKYIAYFQAFTNTYGPVERLEALYRAAMEPEDVVGLAIGTRPDCLEAPVVALLEKLNRIKPVSVELGLQTVHEKTIRYIRRGYVNQVYLDAVARLKQAGIEVVTHIILGLPGETMEMAAETTRQAVAAGTDGVKFHLLHVLTGTDLEQDYRAGKFRCLELEEYAQWLKVCLAVLPPEVVVHRITGDGAKRDLVAPLWSADKKRVLNYLNRYLAQS